jgi:hypothetical protein
MENSQIVEEMEAKYNQKMENLKDQHELVLINVRLI